MPPQSSTLGDRRENAETIQANHRDMCRFWGRDDYKYDQVGGELKDIVDGIAQSSADKAKSAIALEGETLLRSTYALLVGLIPSHYNRQLHSIHIIFEHGLPLQKHQSRIPEHLPVDIFPSLLSGLEASTVGFPFQRTHLVEGKTRLWEVDSHEDVVLGVRIDGNGI